MKRTLSLSVRRVVLLALVPVPTFGCGNSTADASKVDAMAGGSSGGGTSSSGGSSSSAGGSSSGDGSSGAGPSSDASSSGGGSSSDACLPGTAPSCLAACRACDPQAYNDGGAGPCAPHWVLGDGCWGGHVLFPCGVPPLPQAPDDSGIYVPVCPTYCMGSSFFACAPWADGGYVTDDGGYSPYLSISGGPGVGGPGGLAYYAEAGIAPAVVACGLDCTGRRPATLLAEPAACVRTAGEVLARAAYLEAASVAAFLDLATQVEAHGAPRALVRSLRRAARDEVRHARDVEALARDRGGAPAAVELAKGGPRSLLAIALENAREGCVRETWGAACAVAQSMRATDLEIRRAMRVIARDELRHAALSWDLAEWLASRLTPGERARVDEERDRALANLEADLQRWPDEAWHATLGFPTRSEARAILQGMHSDVWAHVA